MPDFLAYGKRSIALQLRSEAGRATLRRLIERADVFLDPYRPGVMESMGCGPKEMMALNQRLIYARLTGFGQDGPYAKMAGHDINYLAVSGSLSVRLRSK